MPTHTVLELRFEPVLIWLQRLTFSMTPACLRRGGDWSYPAENTSQLRKLRPRERKGLVQGLIQVTSGAVTRDPGFWNLS